MQCAVSNYRLFFRLLCRPLSVGVVKSYKCYHTNPFKWKGVNCQGLELLSLPDLERYRDEFPDEEDLQDEWLADIVHPVKHIHLLVGQKDDEDIRAETDEENFYLKVEVLLALP